MLVRPASGPPPFSAREEIREISTFGVAFLLPDWQDRCMEATTTTDRPTYTYRKTKAGEWVVFGPAAALTPGTIAIVTKRDGSKKPELIERVGRSFDVDGVEMAYGYIDRTFSTPSHSHSSGHLCDECHSAPGTRWATDSSGFRGKVCASCYGPSYTLSFA